MSGKLVGVAGFEPATPLVPNEALDHPYSVRQQRLRPLFEPLRQASHELPYTQPGAGTLTQRHVHLVEMTVRRSPVSIAFPVSTMTARLLEKTVDKK